MLYQRFGDAGILADQFESMHTRVDYIASIAGETYRWSKGFQFGDWLDPTAPPNEPWKARTDKVIVAGAYFTHSADWWRVTQKCSGAQLNNSIKRIWRTRRKPPSCTNM